MALVPLELPTQSNPGRYTADGETRLINCYAESRGREGKILFPLYASDGLKTFGSALPSAGETRGIYRFKTKILVVNKSTLYSIDSVGTATEIEGIPGDGRVYFAENQKSLTPQVAIVTEDGQRFVFEDDVLSEITDTDLPAPNSVVFLDGYTVYGIPDGRIFYSSLDEATEIAALDFVEAEGSPDGLKRLFVRRRELWALGEKTIEIFGTTTDSNNPFQRLGGSFMERGCLSGASVANLEEAVVWVADDGTVRAAAAYNPERISTHAVEDSIAEQADKAKLIGYSYSARGHSFYVLTGDAFTWVFDATTGQWHERESHELSRWRVSAVEKFNDKNIAGDFTNGQLYEIDRDTYDEAGSHLPVIVRIPITGYPSPIIINTLHVDTMPGQGLNSTDPHNKTPLLAMKTSRDGGLTYGIERTASMGKIGEYTKRVKFNRLGRFNEDGGIIELSMSAAVVRALTGLAGDITKLAAN